MTAPVYETKPQVDSLHYFGPDYCTPERMASYGCQFREIMAFNPKTVMEVGCGAGVLNSLLNKAGVETKTLDFDRRLKPDLCASATHLPFRDKAFDVVGCFQVLEHLPYELFIPSVRELFRVARKGVVFSIPDVSRYFHLYIHAPRLGEHEWMFPINRPGYDLQFSGEHYWEIGWHNITAARIEQDLKTQGLLCARHHRSREYAYHHFFILNRPSLRRD